MKPSEEEEVSIFRYISVSVINFPLKPKDALSLNKLAGEIGFIGISNTFSKYLYVSYSIKCLSTNASRYIFLGN